MEITGPRKIAEVTPCMLMRRLIERERELTEFEKEETYGKKVGDVLLATSSCWESRDGMVSVRVLSHNGSSILHSITLGSKASKQAHSAIC